MVIVLIDSEEQVVTICDKVVERIPWHDIERIYSKIKDKPVYYITGAEEVSPEDVIGLLEEVTPRYQAPKKKPNKKSGRLVMHSKKPGNIIIKYIDPKETDNDIVLQGPLHFYNVPRDIDKFYSEYPDIEKYIELDYIEIVDSSEEKEIRERYNPELLKQQFIRSKSKPKNNEEETGNEDYIHIDITNDVKFAKSGDTNILMDDEQKKILRQINKR